MSLGIAIPSFGQAQFVQETLESLKPICIPFEAIIQDGGSDDSTLAQIEKAVGDDERFHLRVEPDSGQSDAINRAWRYLLPRHPVVTWVNTDDVYRPEAYSSLVRHLWRHPEVVVAYGDFTIIDAAGKPIGDVRRPGRIPRSLLLHYYNAVPGFGHAIRSDALCRAGSLDVDLHYAMDYDLWLRLSRQGRLERFPANVVSFRWHAEAKTAGQNARSNAEVEAVAARHGGRGGAGHALQRFRWRVVGKTARALGIWREVPMSTLTSVGKSRGRRG